MFVFPGLIVSSILSVDRDFHGRGGVQEGKRK